MMITTGNVYNRTTFDHTPFQLIRRLNSHHGKENIHPSCVICLWFYEGWLQNLPSSSLGKQLQWINVQCSEQYYRAVKSEYF